MNCPHCKALDTQVKNSRETKAGSEIWRRRTCAKCKKIFSTYESPRLNYLVIKKKSGNTTRYLSHKLFASIYDAIAGGKHNDRGDSAILAHEVLGVIEHEIIVSGKEILRTRDLIEMVTDTLETRDLGACYRYAAFSPHRGMKFGI